MAFKKLVLGNFGKLQKGVLEVETPGGEVLRFGGLSPEPRALIRVRNPAFWRRCVLNGAIGFAESYIEGEWETPDLVRVIAFFILNTEEADALRKPGKRTTGAFNLLEAFDKLRHRLRPNSLRTARKNIREHYDLSNDFFRLWLDPSMTYSSAYFEEPGIGLEEAQQRKYARLCRKLELKPSDHLLEIGSGWGGMAIHAAKNFGCRVTSITISEEQFREASARVEAAGLAGRARIVLQDYREIEGEYDKIVSIEMIEAVGDRYLEEFFSACSRALKKDGILALQMITCPDRQFAVLRDGVDFIQKHIFPGSLLLAQHRVTQAMMRTGDFNLLDWKDLGPHYALTLRLWAQEFERRLDAVRALGFSDRFIRKWRYYLAYCEAAFGTRHISVVQAVYTRPDNLGLAPGPYQLWR